MKKNLILKSVFMFGIAGLLFTGCSDDDTTAPVITLIGSDPMTISLNTTSVSDPGATAEDDEDGTIAVVESNWSSTNPNLNLAGTYIVTYSAVDAAGNVGEATRTVIVANDAGYLAGTYSTTEGADTWTQTITASTTVNNRIIFSRFANYDNNDDIYAQVIGTAVELPTTQTAIGVGNFGCTQIFTPNGSGTPISQVSGKYRFSIMFTDQQQIGGVNCPGTGAVAYVDVFVQQ
jgi:Bacterial surface protein, Ig-like domain